MLQQESLIIGLVDLNSRRLIVHRDQQPDGVTPSASSYRQVISLDETGAVQPIVMPTTTVRGGGICCLDNLERSEVRQHGSILARCNLTVETVIVQTFSNT